VNLEFLTQIEPLESGEARLLLKDGPRVPCSRRYRGALRGELVTGEKKEEPQKGAKSA
jgi:DNA-binding LytR/AlgR family response regulator